MSFFVIAFHDQTFTSILTAVRQQQMYGKYFTLVKAVIILNVILMGG